MNVRYKADFGCSALVCPSLYAFLSQRKGEFTDVLAFHMDFYSKVELLQEEGFGKRSSLFVSSTE